MARLLITISLMIALAACVDRQSEKKGTVYAAIVIIYALFVGLRTSYNDTAVYIRSFNQADSLGEFLASPTRTNIMHNPLFYGIFAWARGLTENYHVVFLAFAIIAAVLLIRFIYNHCYSSFPFAILIFWGFGTGMFAAAAMKQITAMAILTLAYDAMLEKRWLSFLATVLVASLIHTYAIMFLMVPFFATKPWNWRTMVVVILTGFVMLTFNSTILRVLEYADDAGKSVASFEVFDGVSMNFFRVALYGITPVTLLLYRERLTKKMDENQFVLSNMSIIAFMFALLGSINGANMFGRLAAYFVLGDICMLGWIIDNMFSRRNRRAVYALATVLFFVFIIYDNRAIDAYGGYKSISILRFLMGEV